MRTRTIALCVLLASASFAYADEKDRAKPGSAPVTVLPVEPLGLEDIRVNGHVIPRWSAKVGSRVAGHIISFGAGDDDGRLDVGSRVAKGDVLFRVDSRAFEAKLAAERASEQRAVAELKDLQAGTRAERIVVSEAAVAEVDARIEELRRDLDRYRRLVEEDKTAPPKKLEEVETHLRAAEADRSAALARLAEGKAGATATAIAVAEARVAEAAAHAHIALIDLEDTTIKAAFDGVITQRFRSVGDYVNPAPFIEVLELVSDRDIEAEFTVPEREFAQLVSGETEVVLSASMLDSSITTRAIRRVGAIDPTTGLFTVRASIDRQQAEKLVPGVWLQCTVKLTGASRGVVISPSALLRDQRGPYVYVAVDGAMRRRDVTVGDKLSDGVIVTAGLGATDRVVVGPPAELADGNKLPIER